MPLPSFNLPGKNIGADKQMSMMRTYLAQLKDETEAELYNIRWDNLSKDLREKIEALDYDIQTNTEYVEGVNQNVGTLRADVISANYVNATQVNALIGSFDYVKAGIINANWVTASQVNAQIGAFDYVGAGIINANWVTASYVKTNILTSTYIRSTILSSDNVNAAFSSIETINANAVQVSSNIKTNVINCDFDSKTYRMTPTVMNGKLVFACNYP